MTQFDTSTKLVLITGGSSGIGKAVAKVLFNAGAQVILLARDLDKLELAACEISHSGTNISYYATNLSKQQEVEQVTALIVQNEGIPDIVINSAGAGEWLSLKEATLDHYSETINSPYLAAAYTTKSFYDSMLKRGTGHFVFINSAACYFSIPAATGYTAARWALLGFAKSLQADLKKSNFDISMVAFGKVSTPYFDNNPISEERIPKIVDWLIPTLTKESAAKIIFKTIVSRKRTVIKPRAMQLAVILNRLFPSLFDLLMEWTGYRNHR